MPMHNPAHPGLILRDYIGDIPQGRFAEELGVSRNAITRVLNGHAGISADMALKLATHFPNTDPEFWLRMQMHFDLWQAKLRQKAA